MKNEQEFAKQIEEVRVGREKVIPGGGNISDGRGMALPEPANMVESLLIATLRRGPRVSQRGGLGQAIKRHRTWLH